MERRSVCIINRGQSFFDPNTTTLYFIEERENIMRKILSAVLCTVLAASVLVGCGGTKAETTTTTTEATSSASKETTEETTGATATEMTIEHSKGTTVVPMNPQKVVVFDLGILDIMDSLGVDVDVAVPTDNLTSYLEKYASATNAGGIKQPDIEGIYEFQPDVIFISGRQSDYYDELNEIAPTVYVDQEATAYMEDFEKNVNMIAELFGKQEEATKQLDEIKQLIAEGQEKAEASDEKALIVLTNDGSISAYGKGSRFGIVHDVLGVKVADDSIEVSTHGQEASFEYISKVNPDILFVIDRTAVVGGETGASDTLDNELVKETNAGKNNKIVYLDAETWYLGGAGLTSIRKMVEEVVNAL